MSEARYDIYFRGDLLEGFYADFVKADMAQLFKTDPARLEAFFSGKPQFGKLEFATQYDGADWHFFNQANMDLFLTNPELFAPQYGGYCAWAVAKGKLAPGNPDYWHVEDGRLFFNYNARVKRRWQKKQAKHIQKADQHWPKLQNN